MRAEGARKNVAIVIVRSAKCHNLALYKIPCCAGDIGAIILIFEREIKNKETNPLIPFLPLPLMQARPI